MALGCYRDVGMHLSEDLIIVEPVHVDGRSVLGRDAHIREYLRQTPTGVEVPVCGATGLDGAPLARALEADLLQRAGSDGPW